MFIKMIYWLNKTNSSAVENLHGETLKVDNLYVQNISDFIRFSLEEKVITKA